MGEPVHIRHARRGISMAETIVATLIIGLVLVSTIEIVGPMVRSTSVHADRLVAANLANELSEEIATKAFIDTVPDSDDDLGPDAGERPAVRADFDDVDDYAGWTSTPPMLSSNSSMTSLAGWTRAVKVTHAQLSDPTSDSGTNTGLKRVVVVVSKNGVTLAEVTSLHAQAAESLGFMSEE